MAILLDGKKLASKIKEEISEKLKSAEKAPTLGAILVGEDPSSKTYLKLKDKDCTEVGIDFQNFNLPADSTQEEVLELIEDLNHDERIEGIIVQLPVPEHLDRNNILKTINPNKDVDGLNPHNVGKLWISNYDFDKDLLPCTPKGIMRLLDNYDVEFESKDAVIVNRSDLVGKPLAKLLLDRNATVTLCHSRTKGLKKKTAFADILVTAVGTRPIFTVTKDMVSKGSVVVDVGMNYLDDGLCGDVKFEEVEEKASHITPVPGGIGPMTRVMLLENVMIAGGYA